MKRFSKQIQLDRRNSLPFPTGPVRALVVCSVLSLLVTIPHVVEDFHFGIAARFHLPLLLAASALGGGYALQVCGLLLAVLQRRSGYLLSLAIGAGWFIGAVADHLPDVLFTVTYRSGLVSKALEVLIMLLGLGIMLFALAALRTGERMAGERQQVKEATG